uniref:Ig-like domain-containing protein n=1 Tax=Paramormyrops kingsleyae TaxID=1676925 RepID=A0A3B3SFF8_9TELE
LCPIKCIGQGILDKSEMGSVTLNCSNKTWALVLFVTWTIDIDGKQCQMAHSDNDPKYDTCNDGKILCDNTNLHIPHFAKRDEGRYQCETVFKDGYHIAVITVTAKVPQQISTRLDPDHREAVCSATGVKSDVSISWRTSWNATVTSSSVHNPDGSYTMEIRLKLPDHVYGTTLQCIVTHPSWTENYTQTLQLPGMYKFNQTCITVLVLLSYIVDCCLHNLVLPRNSCSSFSVAVGHLAAYLTSFHLVFSSVLEGRPVLGNITVIPYFFHVLMTVFMVFHGISNVPFS